MRVYMANKKDLSQIEYLYNLREKGLITNDEFSDLNILGEKIKADIIDANFLGGKRLGKLMELFSSYKKCYITESELKYTKYSIMNIERETIIISELIKKKEVDMGDQLKILWICYDTDEEETEYVTILYKDLDVILFDNGLKLHHKINKNNGKIIYRIEDMYVYEKFSNGYRLLKIEKE